MSNGYSLDLPPADDLFSTQEERDDAKLERVNNIQLDLIDDFPEHPFHVRNDESMNELVDSIYANGVISPIRIRPKEGGRYEIVSGHRRMMASVIVGLNTIPAIIRNMDRDEAILIMVDSNLQREQVQPSEKAFAYKMKLDVIRRKAGRPPKDNLRPVVGNFESADIVGNDTGDSGRQIQRYIRLTELISPILEMVDERKIAFRPAVEISYLTKGEQTSLFQTMEIDDCTPSLAQAIKMKNFSKEGRLSDDVILSIMAEEKGNQVEQFKIPRERISKFFSVGTPKERIESDIIKGLELLRKRERDRSDAR